MADFDKIAAQRRDAMRIVERDSGTEGVLLRPLCAQLLKPTGRNWKGWWSGIGYWPSPDEEESPRWSWQPILASRITPARQEAVS
jgi:hypothetical protein